jgi:hypothetical protein
MNQRPRPRDDHELQQMTGIRPADHAFVPRSAVEQAERKMLGAAWYRRRKKPDA